MSSTISPDRAPREFLETHGLVSSVPCIRSSDFSLVNSCRFLYYLTRRLHLRSPFAESASSALVHGTWFHTRLEALDLTPPAVSSFMQRRIGERLDEIDSACALLDISGESRARLKHEAREDAVTAWMWFEAASTYSNPRYPQLAKGFLHYLRNTGLTLLDKEVTLRLKHPRYPRTLLCAQLDELRFNPETKALWLVDAKTCTGSPRHRLALCTVEDQPRHYLYICRELLPLLIAHYALPGDTTLGGIIHLAVQKPSIRFSQADRPYTLYSLGQRKKMQGRAVLKNGRWACTAWDISSPHPSPTLAPYKATSEEDAHSWLQEACGKLPEKQYSGEPSPSLYKARCAHWYNGTGDYADKKPERDSEDCPVNISTTSSSILLDPRVLSEYSDSLDRVYKYATCPADPSSFDRTADGLRSFDDPTSGMARFYNTPVSAWPALVRELKLLQIPRDDGVNPLGASSIQPRTPTE